VIAEKLPALHREVAHEIPARRIYAAALAVGKEDRLDLRQSGRARLEQIGDCRVVESEAAADIVGKPFAGGAHGQQNAVEGTRRLVGEDPAQADDGLFCSVQFALPQVQDQGGRCDDDREARRQREQEHRPDRGAHVRDDLPTA